MSSEDGSFVAPAKDNSMSAGPHRWVELLPWLAAGLSCWPLVRFGFPMGHDWLLELVRISEYRAAVAGGQFPPYWAENIYGGYGSPAFLFYAPLFSAVSSLLSWVCGSIVGGAVGATILFSFVAVVSLRIASRTLLDVSGPESERGWESPLYAASARVGATFFVLHPYLLGDKYARNASAEFAALCLMPLALYGALIASSRPRSATLWLSAGLALTILAHNLTALVAVTLIGGIGLCSVWLRSVRLDWITIGGGIGLGLGMSAFFWLPAVTLTSLVRVEDLLRGKFDFHNQFPNLIDLMGYGEFYSAGAATPAVLILSIIVLAVRWRGLTQARRVLWTLAWIGTAVLIAMSLRFSTPIWEQVPMLPLFQFPWRLMGPVALLCALLLALSFGELTSRWSVGRRTVAEVLLWIVCALNAWSALQSVQPIRPQLRDRLPELLHSESVRRGSHSVTVADEYLPRSAEKSAIRRPRPLGGPLVEVAGRAKLGVLRDRGTDVLLSVRAEEDTRLTLARWAFPGWVAKVGDASISWTENPAGLIDVVVPAGDSELSLRMEPPFVRKLGLVLSGLSLVLWLGLVLVGDSRATSISTSR